MQSLAVWPLKVSYDAHYHIQGFLFYFIPVNLSNINSLVLMIFNSLFVFLKIN